MNPLNHSLRNSKNEHICAICCRLAVAGDVISGADVKTGEGYAVSNFEVASFGSFWYIDSIKLKRIRILLKNGSLQLRL